jgi:DNA-binding NarL/FixJ family response regulator
VIVDDIRKCIKQIFSPPADEGFEIVVIDTNLQNSRSSTIELAKTIKNASPDQKIVITTTSPLTEVDMYIKPTGTASDNLEVSYG